MSNDQTEMGERVLLKNGDVVLKSSIGSRFTRRATGGLYGYISHQGGLFQVRQVAPHCWRDVSGCLGSAIGLGISVLLLDILM